MMSSPPQVPLNQGNPPSRHSLKNREPTWFFSLTLTPCTPICVPNLFTLDLSTHFPVYPDGRLLRSLSLSQVPSLFGSSLSVPPGWLLILMLYFPAHDIPRIPCNFHVLPCTQLCPFSWISPNIPPLVATGPGSRQPQFLQPSGGSQ